MQNIDVQNIDLLAIQYDLPPLPTHYTAIAPPVMQSPQASQPPVHQPVVPAPVAPQPQSATQQFWAAVKSEISKGETRQAAIAQIVRANPDLHANYLSEVNTQRPAPPKQQPATAAYMQLVAAQIKATGCTRGEAMQFVNRTHADIRNAYVDEANHR